MLLDIFCNVAVNYIMLLYTIPDLRLISVQISLSFLSHQLCYDHSCHMEEMRLAAVNIKIMYLFSQLNHLRVYSV
jgi:hypothetical protein